MWGSAWATLGWAHVAQATFIPTPRSLRSSAVQKRWSTPASWTTRVWSRRGARLLTVTVDGMHSRLSDYPFLAGFHVTRAALRDVYVMGAKPVALLSDVHLADDGDVSKLFDHIAGIATVSELIGVPLITGSTLRIGGDMVIGDRLTGCVGAVGVSDKLTARKSARPGDVIMMTEGAGGGTICSAALYFDRHEVDETLNIKFLEASEAGLLKVNAQIHAMTDVTNGGIRGDAKEISYTAGVKLIFEEERMRRLVNPRCLRCSTILRSTILGCPSMPFSSSPHRRRRMRSVPPFGLWGEGGRDRQG